MNPAIGAARGIILYEHGLPGSKSTRIAPSYSPFDFTTTPWICILFALPSA
jgi:hypothetical protein